MRAGWPRAAVLLVLLLPNAFAQGGVLFALDPETPVAGVPAVLEVAFPGPGASREVRLVESPSDTALTEGSADLHVHHPTKGRGLLHGRVPGATQVVNVTGALPDGARFIAGEPSAVDAAGSFSVPVVFPFAGAWNVTVETDAGRREATIRVPEGPGLVATARGSDGATLLAVREAPARFHVGEETLEVIVVATRDFRAYEPLDGATAVASAFDAATGRRVPDTPLAPAPGGRHAGRFEIPAAGTWEVRVNVTHPDHPTTRILSAGPVSRLPVEAAFAPVDGRVWRATAVLATGSFAVLAHGTGEDAAWRFDVAPAPRPYVSLHGAARPDPGAAFDLALVVARPDGEPLAGARDVEAVVRDAHGVEVARATLMPDGAAYLWRGLALPEKGAYAIHVAAPSLGLA
ncbi:MAG TPA: hypothetical protein VM889_04735, partial [Candidatus Thermoplasmatota archaeon]|nr:hypothetical protein [Candidatus Thermoplasmatota archaeon]